MAKASLKPRRRPQKVTCVSKIIKEIPIRTYWPSDLFGFIIVVVVLTAFSCYFEGLHEWP